MRLKALILRNFRCYSQEIRLPIDESMTALIGKNDIGKSTILEALEIFFNSELVKIAQNDSSMRTQNNDVTIGCVFDDLPTEVVLDATSKTTLAGEFLLNQDGDLQIYKIFDCGLKSPKVSVYALANHPTASQVGDLLKLKNAALKERFRHLSIDRAEADMRSNAALRQAIWSSFGPEALSLEPTLIPLDQEDAKKIWDQLQKFLPIFALFRSDRPSTDQDSEIQDPMKLAVDEAMRSVEDDLERIKQEVQKKATEVAQRTLEKLREMDPNLAGTLAPNFTSEPRWSGLFKLSLTSDDDIPINKRGSGVRRLILLNFFRAQAEMRLRQANAPSIIYAIEEPETSQHPHNQKMLLQALVELAGRSDYQVLITTHVPGLAGYLPLESLRYIDRDTYGENRIRMGSEEVNRCVASDLGVLPNSRVQLLVCVEGPTDVSFLCHVSRAFHEYDPRIPDLGADDRVALFPVGGSTLIQWVQSNYLRGLGRQEVHIYDNDKPEYQSACNEVIQRGDGSWATLTGKREIENYIHPDVIYQLYCVRVNCGPFDDVPQAIAEAVHSADSSSGDWSNLSAESIKKKVSRVKKRLIQEGASLMTMSQIREIDPNGDIEHWLREISSRLT